MTFNILTHWKGTHTVTVCVGGQVCVIDTYNERNQYQQKMFTHCEGSFSVQQLHHSRLLRCLHVVTNIHNLCACESVRISACVFFAGMFVRVCVCMCVHVCDCVHVCVCLNVSCTIWLIPHPVFSLHTHVHTGWVLISGTVLSVLWGLSSGGGAGMMKYWRSRAKPTLSRQDVGLIRPSCMHTRLILTRPSSFIT